MNKTPLAMLAGLAGFAIFGLSFLFSKVALEVASPFVLLSVRFVTAFLVMTAGIFLFRVPMQFKGKPVHLLLLMGLIQPGIYFVCETYGIAMTTASFSGIMLGLAPVVGLVLGRIFLKEKATKFQVLCAFLSIFGVALTSLGGELGFSPLGVALLAGAAFTAAAFNVVSRHIAPYFSPLERTYIMSALGSVIFTAIALVQNGSDLSAFWVPMTSGGFWVAVFYLAVVSSIGAFLLINFATGVLPISVMSVFSNFATVISVLAGIFILGDDFNLRQIIGIVIITVSVCGVTFQKSPKA